MVSPCSLIAGTVDFTNSIVLASNIILISFFLTFLSIPYFILFFAFRPLVYNGYYITEKQMCK